MCVHTLSSHYWPQITNESLNHTLGNGCQGLNLPEDVFCLAGAELQDFEPMFINIDVYLETPFLDFFRNGNKWLE